MKEFLGYIRGESEEGKLVKKIADAVEEARQNHMWSMEFMSLNAHLMDAESKGIRKGRKQGEQKNAKDVYNRLIGRGMSQSEALEISGYKP